MSAPSGIVFVNGYTKQEGWEVTDMDWTTGETVHRTIFGQDNLGNGAYAIIQFFLKATCCSTASAEVHP